ncbi:SRPBCC family protein [Mangrovibacterium lignilyticum]|uniref:SRPBCC family protein n=1 Tax=Mangrovibacterium lignilyticum TaxID=2668052 RepID=UPI0013D4B21D|nr:SRPBCC family protein [Mangrovibacterium lignilyticum]
MAVQKYVSDIKIVEQNQEVVYNYLSNFDNLSTYVNEGLLSKINESVPQIKVTDFESDADSCRFNISGMGKAEIRIIEREPVSTIKINSSGGLPIGITFWIQLLPVTPYQSKMKLTLHAEMSMMIKMMVNKKLEDGINQLADMLTNLPYR